MDPMPPAEDPMTPAEDPMDPQMDPNPAPPDGTFDPPPGPLGEPLPNDTPEQVDAALFQRLKAVFDVFESTEVWKGYDYHKIPQFLLGMPDGSKTPSRGYVINPPSVQAGMEKLDEAQGYGIEVYRFDVGLQAAYDHLQNESNGAYTFDYDVGPDKFYLQTYGSFDIQIGQAIQLSIHELFHGKPQRGWKYGDFQQDFDGFPIQLPTLELQILVMEILENIGNVSDKDELRERLAQYVAARTEERAVDQSGTNLIAKHTDGQETNEGSASYVERLATRLADPSLFGGVGLTYQGDDYMTDNQYKESALDMMGFNAFYNSGGAAIYALRALGGDIYRLEEGVPPFAVAKELLGLSQQELADALERAKVDHDWPAVQARAKELIAR